jgi:hypothetical protein
MLLFITMSSYDAADHDHDETRDHYFDVDDGDDDTTVSLATMVSTATMPWSESCDSYDDDDDRDDDVVVVHHLIRIHHIMITMRMS